MSSDKHKILMLGLKASGKTTFLAALWEVIENKSSKSSLISPQLQPNREYLNRIRSKWLKLEPVTRTGLQETKDINLFLQSKDKDLSFEIDIPDVSGESYHVQFQERHASKSYLALAAEASGILLFIHSKDIKFPERIETTMDDTPSTGGEHKTVPWTADMAPTQVYLVDLLQTVLWARKAKPPLKFGIVISAWDLVTERITPKGWLEINLPLLYQFLQVGKYVNDFKVFGVSSTGGDLVSDQSRLEELLPLERIKILAEDFGSSNDLTLPLKFLTE